MIWLALFILVNSTCFFSSRRLETIAQLSVERDKVQ